MIANGFGQALVFFVRDRDPRIGKEHIGLPGERYKVNVCMRHFKSQYSDTDTSAIDDLLHCQGNFACKDHHACECLFIEVKDCLLYTSDAADDLLCVDLGGR